MFDSLSDKLQNVFRRIQSKGVVRTEDVELALKEVRMALLEADVNFQVVKTFIASIRERAIGAEVLESLTPAQQVIKIVHEELIKLLGEPAPLNIDGPTPRVIMMVGLQGTGKTTMSAKLGLYLRKNGQRPLLVAADTRRPAAITQLQTLGKQLDIPVFAEGDKLSPPEICTHAVAYAKDKAYTVVILDTAGRLHIDDDLMRELEQVRANANPNEVLLTVDAMTGQDAVRSADEFNKRTPLTGLVLTKVDGDARGGAALSIRAISHVPIKFMGVGEKPDALEPFYPDRLASRILGMGDVLTLIEKAQENLDMEIAREAGEKMLEGQFDLDDFLKQMKQLKKMGSISNLFGMIPGMSRIKNEIDDDDMNLQMKRVEAIISSMTMDERRSPRVLNASRRRRISRGSGTSVQEVNELMKQFREMQKMMAQIRTPGGMRNFMNMFR
ncbi:MAG: signal recognition particle protein [Chloroflexi bacterium]|nr:signal recognition particle protein [Chloroflexota bacterium]